MTPVTGWFADRIGRRELFLVTVVGFTITSMLCGIAWSLGSIVLALMALAPRVAVVPIGRIVAATIAYLAVSVGPFALRRDRRLALPSMQAALLLDGIYLAAVVAFVGAAHLRKHLAVES